MHPAIQIIVKDVLAFHQHLEKNSVILEGVRDYGLLESSIHTPFQSFGGEDLYPTVFDKAAQLCYGIAKNHPFVDGNKRTALHTMLVYLRLNNINLVASKDEFKAFIVGVAASQIDPHQMAIWLEKHAKTISP